MRELEADYFRLKEVVGHDVIGEEQDSDEENLIYATKSKSTTMLETLMGLKQRRQSVFKGKEEKKSFVEKHLEIMEIKKEVKER